jgi:hypothetical protein
MNLNQSSCGQERQSRAKTGVKAGTKRRRDASSEDEGEVDSAQKLDEQSNDPQTPLPTKPKKRDDKDERKSS